MPSGSPIAPGQPDFNIAVVGSGIAGMSAAWLLSHRHRVTLFEKESWLGGHAHTVDVPAADGRQAVDTGFIVYNPRNYPNLVALFDHLGVATHPSVMSFSASLDGGDFEYGSTSLNDVLGQRRNLLRPRFWSMMGDLLRFYRETPRLLDTPGIVGLSLGDYLDREGYSAAFADDHILPMSAAIWSTTPDRMRGYPLESFIRFCVSHQLLQIRNRPTWMTVTGGSRQYVEKLTRGPSLRRGVGVRRIVRREGEILIEVQRGAVESFSHVVIATHADQALALLEDPSADEQRVLSAFTYSSNRTILHQDAQLMPRRRRVWSSWNFIGGRRTAADQPLCVSYWMNRLQGIDPGNPLFVTLNPIVEPTHVLGEFVYTHPLFGHAALSAQGALGALQGRRNTWYCGSYFGYGFHEDALQAGLAVAEDLGGVRRPWVVEDPFGRLPGRPPTSLSAEPVRAP